MLSLDQLYKILEFERNQILNHFETIHVKHFHYRENETTWSPEMIFRHILMSLRWMSGLLPNGPIETPDIALLPGKIDNCEYTATYDEVCESFDTISPLIRNGLEKLTLEQANAEILTKNFLVIRKVVLTRLITHEYKHLGQIVWLLKRSTGWTDNNLYKIDFEETTWDIPKTSIH